MHTIVITGASRGIGREIALRMLQHGHNVVLNYHADDALAEQTISECRNISDSVLLVKADVSRSVDVGRHTGD